jgi:hypothetical protein
MVEASSPCSKDIMLFNRFGSLAIEPVVSDLPLPILNDIGPYNSTKVPIEGSKKSTNSVVFNNCPVKKRNRISLSPIAKSAIVPTTVIPVTDAESSIYTYLRSMKMEQCEQFAPVCSSKCSSVYLFLLLRQYMMIYNNL